MRMKLLWVEGEAAAEFSDLLGLAGRIVPGERGAAFLPDGTGDILTLGSAPIPTQPDADGRVRVRTKLGNTFVFRAEAGPSPSGKGA